MKEINAIVKRLKYPVATIVLVTACYICLTAKETFSAATKNYTRDELQKMVVSAAVSYYYNNYYSDYEQYLLDSDIVYPYIGGNDVSDKGANKCILDYQNKTGCVSADNYYPLVSTTFYRNLKITPEEVR